MVRIVNNQVEILEKASEIKKQFASEEVDEKAVQVSFMAKLHELMQTIFEDDTDAAYELLEKGELIKYKKNSWRRKLKSFFMNNIKNAFYLTFMISIIGFLVNEAVIFYAVDGVVTANTYAKAILTELSFIFLSGYVAETKMMQVVSKLLLASVFALMLFVISAETLKQGTSGVEESKIIAVQIERLNTQIAEKEKLIKYYVKIEWPRNATTTRIEKDKLTTKLNNLLDDQAGGKNNEVTTIEKYKSYGKAFFRVILLLINMLITRRVFKF